MKLLVAAALRGYKRWISPVLPQACRFVPTCSEYALEAVERYGIVHGGWLALWRLLRCHPLAGAGYDPVPSETLGSGRCCDGIGSAAIPKPMSRQY